MRKLNILIFNHQSKIQILQFNTMQLIITNLNKTYDNGVQALKDVSLTINQGMFGLLGPNGAGKSSLMRTIATLQEADSGSISLGDINVLTQKKMSVKH